ncbi:MAG: 3-oxoacyl-[acyl-carrier-protein] reductase [Holosporales bacterium]|jgi:3-oxoacyl-[acyl-carrier protein] reductase|nr:3-oxoacyl-[acyl-carrier-protein] reductase [Holosporales bacterium]
MFDLKGKIALVTGATGDIGAAIARALHTANATVALSGTRREALAHLADELGERVHSFPCNLADTDATEKLIPNVGQVLGNVDILVNNAGIVRDGLLMRMSDEAWEHVLAVNLESPFRLMRAAIKNMLGQHWGRIINITSIVGVTGNAGQANYATSKAGLIGLTKSTAAEVAARGITVNCIAPGFIASAMTDSLTDEQKQHFKEAIPVRRAGTPEEVAAAALFLASSEASYMTGQTLHVNGGLAMI